MSRDHSQNHYGPNASFDGYDSDLASAGILIESLRQQLSEWIAANGPNGWIDELRQQLAEAKAVSDHNLKVYQDAAESLRQQLAAAQAAIKVKNHTLFSQSATRVRKL